jgi:citrate lyase beta subunit
MRARRALLYIPGNDLHKIEKGAGLDVDCIVLDLEDAVSSSSKQEAREITSAALRSMDFGTSERLVRINALYTELAEKDLEMIVPARPDAILLSKTTQASDVTKLSEILLKYEQDAGWQEGSIKIFGVIETAMGIINLKEICQADPRLQVIICGGEDLAADFNAIRTRAAAELSYARSAVILHAAAFQLQAIDMVNADFTNEDQLFDEARQGMEMGFSGKQVIHPNQIEIVQRAFTPDQEEIEYALQIISQFDSNEENGQGAFALDGVMVDRPVVTRARHLLERARAAGKLI